MAPAALSPRWLHCALAAPVLAAGLGSGTEKPHIVLVLVDDWGWNNVGYHRPPGDPEVQTPTIDGLVKEGIELDRHYTYHYCSPSRTSLQSGRLAVHVAYGHDSPLLHNPKDPVSGFSGIPRNMTGIAEKLRAGGYRTHMTGKWDAGMATWEHTPLGRGYETFFGYFHHNIDYWTQRLPRLGPLVDKCGCLADLWNGTHPAYGRNGTAFVEEMFKENTLNILDQHDTSEPLFLFHAFHLCHTPLQVPQEWEQKFDFLKEPHQRKYAAMVHYMDDILGHIVAKLKAKGMWENTLMVVSSDNGGPTYNLPGPGLGPGSASNRPLKGGKLSDWEGGVRVNAFVSGGAVPEEKRGTKLEDYVHMADWYTTFCAIAGVDPTDHKAALAGLPPIDGVDQSALLLGSARSGDGNRTEIHHSARALLQGRWKLITGGLQLLEFMIDGHRDRGEPWIPFSDYLDGFGIPMQVFRNVSWCGRGCLYDVIGDPYETENVAKKHPDIVKSMMARLKELNKGLFLRNRGKADKTACHAWDGFYGPFVDMPPPEATQATGEAKVLV